jgi:hypothetical protein
MDGRPLRDSADLIDEYMIGKGGPVILHYHPEKGCVMIEPPLRVEVSTIPKDATTLIGPHLSGAA